MSQTNISALACGTVLWGEWGREGGEKGALSPASAPRCICSVCWQCALTSSTGMTGVCALGPVPTNNPTHCRHHLPTDMVTKKVNLCLISPPHSDGGPCSCRLATCNISLRGGWGRGRVQMQPNRFSHVGLMPPPPPPCVLVFYASGFQAHCTQLHKPTLIGLGVQSCKAK